MERVLPTTAAGPAITLGAEVHANGAVLVAVAASGQVVDVRQLWHPPGAAELAEACQVLEARWSQPVARMALACDNPDQWLVLPELFLPAGPELTTLGTATARALAEFQHGALRNCPDCLVVTVGHTLSAGALRQGTPLLPLGRDLALAHLPVVEGGPRCSCGQRGCLQAVASVPAWQRRARDAGLEPPPPAGPDPATDQRNSLGARAARGDAVTLAALTEPVEQIARGIAIVAGAIGVRDLALQWTGTGSGDRLQQLLLTRVRHWWPAGRTVTPAQTGPLGAAWGAALWAQRQGCKRGNS